MKSYNFQNETNLESMISKLRKKSNLIKQWIDREMDENTLWGQTSMKLAQMLIDYDDEDEEDEDESCPIWLNMYTISSI